MDIETSTSDQTDIEIDPWFRNAARKLLGKEAGLQLAIIAGLELNAARGCSRYTNGERNLPGPILCALLRRDDGDTWLSALMDGCDAEWWRDFQRARKIAKAIESVE